MIHDLWFAPLLRCPATIYWAAPIVLSFVILRPMPEENGIDQADALRALRHCSVCETLLGFSLHG